MSLVLLGSGVELSLPVASGRGVAHYDGLRLSTDGRRWDLSGTFDLAAKRFDLELGVSLVQLGGDVERLKTHLDEVG